jgi:hypothetical protein
MQFEIDAVLSHLAGDGGARASDFNEPGIDPKGIRAHAIAAAGQVELADFDPEGGGGVRYRILPSIFPPSLTAVCWSFRGGAVGGAGAAVQAGARVRRVSFSG